MQASHSTFRFVSNCLSKIAPEDKAMNTIMRTNSVDEPKHATTEATALMSPPRPARSVAWIIAASSFAFAVIQLDVTIVNVALSRISEDLGATVTELQWVVDAYTLGFAALLLSAGIVGDRLGSKRVSLLDFSVSLQPRWPVAWLPAPASSTPLEPSKELEPPCWCRAPLQS